MRIGAPHGAAHLEQQLVCGNHALQPHSLYMHAPSAPGRGHGFAAEINAETPGAGRRRWYGSLVLGVLFPCRQL